MSIDNHKIYMIVAADEKNGIGKSGRIPWHFKKEMQYFAKITTATTDQTKKNIVLMGRTTWESLPVKYKPLPNRRNLVLTHQKDYRAQGAEVVDSLDKALILADAGTQDIFIIGGGKVFAEAINHPKLDGIYFTLVHKIYDCDTFFPKTPATFNKIKKEGDDTENGVSFSYFIYSKQAAK